VSESHDLSSKEANLTVIGNLAENEYLTVGNIWKNYAIYEPEQMTGR